MLELLPFFIVLFAGLFFSELFFRFHFPWVLALILGGIILGPSGLDVIVINETIDFMAQIGLVFLMFMAGLETQLLKRGLSARFKSIGRTAVLNSLIPFVVGMFIALMFGFERVTALLVGIIFISSSIAVVVPSLESKKLLRSKLGTSIVSSTIISDVVSLIMLSLLLHETNAKMPIFVLYAFLFAILVLLRYAIPKIQWFFSRESKSESGIFQQELRSVFVLLIGTVVIFELIGLHPIIAGFFAGAVLSHSVTSKILKEKIRALSYGLFIPIFFIVVGAQTNLSLITDTFVLFTFVLITGTIIAKFVTGYFGGRLNSFTKRESLIIGSSTIPQLSTTLAVALIGYEKGLISQPLLATLVLLSLITTFVGPILINIFSSKYIDDEIDEHVDRRAEHYYGQ